MNKTLSAFTASALILAPRAARATWTLDGWNVPADSTAAGIPGAPSNLADTILKLINYILGLISLLAVLMIIWGGIQYLTSAGSQDTVRSAKETIKNALLGLVLAGIAFAVVKLVVTTVHI